MGSKDKNKGQKQNKIAGAPRALSHDGDRERALPELLDCLYEVVAGDTHPSEYGLADREAADRILRAMSDDGLKVLARAEAAWAERVELQKEREAEKDVTVENDGSHEVHHEAKIAAEVHGAPDGTPPPEAEKKVERVPGWRATPGRVVKSSLDCLKWFDWDALGIPGVRAAEALLRNALSECQRREAASGKKRPKKVDVGVVVRIRARHRETYDGVLDVSEMAGLTVISLNGKHARVRTAGGETLVPRVEHLEVDPDAARGAAK